MKPTLILFLLIAHLYDAAADGQDEMKFDRIEKVRTIRRRLDTQHTNFTRRRSKRECIVFLVEKQYEDHRHVDQSLECELQGDDWNGKDDKIVRVKGLTSRWALKNNVTSGVSTIFAPDGADIDDEVGELVIPSGVTIKLGRRNRHSAFRTTKSMPGHRNLQTGIRLVLVIRIEAKDASTSAVERELAASFFGTSRNDLTLKTGFDRCSDGNLRFEPLTTNVLVGSDGVYTVRLPQMVVKGNLDFFVSGAALAQVKTDLKVAPESIADHVILCLPPGTKNNWLAYSIVNGWKSVFNDNWCLYPSVQMHEIGHNLNLGHSNHGAVENDDRSGIMGFVYAITDGPAMCFNAAKTWQLGWYHRYHVDLPIGMRYTWNGTLVGFAEKNSAVPMKDQMILRIRSGVGTDYYIHFNRKTGVNAGTMEGGDKVLVASRPAGTEYAMSLLLATLAVGGEYTIANFNGGSSSLKIVVKSIKTGTIPGRASVSILAGSPQVSSRAPTRYPTRFLTRKMPS